MEQKLAELTKKIYQEGVQKGEDEKKAILEAAKTEAAKIQEAAKKEAEKIIADAEQKATELQRNAESEIKLSARQSLNALKIQITDIVSAKAIDGDVAKALDNQAVLEECIVEICKNWSDKNASLEVLLSEKNQTGIAKSLDVKLKKILSASITISGSKAIQSGFKIGPAGGSYKLSLTDEDFAVFFKEYLRPATRKMLFGE